MSLKPGDAYAAGFTTQTFSTGAATNADSPPAATATRNGTDDAAFVLTVTNMATGRYKITGTIPGTYAAGDCVHISVAATVGGVAGKGIIDAFALDAKRVTDLNDITAASVWAVSTRTLSSFGTLVADIATAIWGAVSRTLTSGSAPSAAQVADAVWDEDMADHLTAGSTGEQLNAAGGVTAGGVTTITEATLDTDSAALGVVQDGSGNAIDGATVGIYADADTECATLLYKTTSDGDGGFSVTVVSGATYRIKPVKSGYSFTVKRVTV